MYKSFLNKIKYKKGHIHHQAVPTGRQAGMTMVELLVVLAIFLIVAGLTIFDYGKFRSTISLQNLADDIALSIRRAQNYAIGVRSTQSLFSYGYGIHFSTVVSPIEPLSGHNKAFVIFADVDGDKIYDAGSGSSCGSPFAGNECVDLLGITSSDIISSICPYTSGSIACTPLGNGYASITFLRPNPDAQICAAASGFSCTLGQYASVDIYVQNLQSQTTKIINVSNVGQISIK